MEEKLFDKIKRVRFVDIGHIFLFLVAFPLSLIYRRMRPDLWLFCEYEEEASDNAYFLYRHVREKHCAVDAVYAIKRHSNDYKKVAALGETVQYGSFKHWLLYLSARVNVSSHKGGKPNAAICYVLEVILGYRNFRAFIQHGVILNDLPYIYYRNSKISLMTCTTSFEHNALTTTYGYDTSNVRITGLCRFDALMQAHSDGCVLVAPTWRHALKNCTARDFQNSAYYRCWQSFLSSKALARLLEQHDRKLKFLVHRNMRAFSDAFKVKHRNIEILQWDDVSVSQLIATAGMCITDYSSISIDIAYMKRPIIYYMFDEEQFRQTHLQPSNFSYRNDGLGEVVTTERDLISKLKVVLEKNMAMPDEYLKRHSNFFYYCDADNCLRTYLAIREKLCED